MAGRENVGVAGMRSTLTALPGTTAVIYCCCASGVVPARRRPAVALALCAGGHRGRLGRRLLRLGAQELAHLRTLGVPPVRQDADIPADAEMLHDHLEIAL